MHRALVWLLVAASAFAGGSRLGCAEHGSCVPEVCNGLDDDCDGATDEELVEECSSICGVGVRQCLAGRWASCSAPRPTDEVCDGLDNDCDTETDEGGTRWYPDADGDGYGFSVGAVDACQPPAGYVANRDDCDDDAPDVHPGATETCDGRDEDCSGAPDEGCDCLVGATQSCGDWGEQGACELGLQSCVAGVWGDCTGGVRPVAETCNDIDDDCDGATDQGLAADTLDPNDTCETARVLETAVEQDARTPLHTSVVETTLYRADGTADVDWYRVVAEEHSGACVPWTTECCYRFTVLLHPPVGMPREDLRLCVFRDGSCGAFPSELCATSSDWNSTEAAYEMTVCWSGTCSYDDGKTFYLRVDSPAGASSCLPYRLRYSFYRTDSSC